MKQTVMVFVALWLLGEGYVHAASVCLKDTCVKVEVVSQTEDLRRGLQGRTELKSGHGMLFNFPVSDIHRFWMKEMTFAIDMIWIDEKGNIVNIAPSCPPCEKEPCVVYAPALKARYVLEVPSGYASRHAFQIGSKLTLRGVKS